MNNEKEIIKEIKAYDENPLTNLSIQDALIILCLQVSCTGPENCAFEAEKIAEIVRRHPSFLEISEHKEDTLKRINTYNNLMVNPKDFQKAVEASLAELTPDKNQTAFKLVVRTCRETGLTEAKRKRLKEIAKALSISDEEVSENIE